MLGAYIFTVIIFSPLIDHFYNITRGPEDEFVLTGTGLTGGGAAGGWLAGPTPYCDQRWGQPGERAMGGGGVFGWLSCSQSGWEGPIRGRAG